DVRRPGTHAFGDAMGEVGAVDDDEDVGCCCDDGFRRLADAPQDRRQLPDDSGEADDGQFLDRKTRGQPLDRHGTAANSLELHGTAETLAQHLHQIGAEPVAGFFRRDQENLSPATWACARRAHVARPVTNKPALSAASIMACGSAAMVLPAPTAMPDSAALATPSTVRGPMTGRS